MGLVNFVGLYITALMFVGAVWRYKQCDIVGYRDHAIRPGGPCASLLRRRT
ncbi:hypothetical protein [Mesorhizobium waimense]|uniref:hypothetical protein n=1 Tax=Mesorhizobium waimense TaxID=1300307 RepID=UPI00142E897A|nr:hypothetical protein [Mesorhizobium waimense]